MVISLHLDSVRNFNRDSAAGTRLPRRLFGIVLFMLCLSVGATTQAAGLTAEVDRQTIIDGEAVVLYLKGTDIAKLPDTSPLNANFRIIQSGQSTSQTIVNGQSSRTITVRLELQPKSLGSSIIPAFTVGNVSSDPITIEVVARGTPGVEPRDKVFAELSVDNPNPYVQEQVVLSLKIFDDGNLIGADPVLDGNSDYQIEKLPLDRERIVERNGAQYRVNTFRYALFPQQSGAITIDEITIPASIRDNSYSGNLILFNTPTRRIELKSDSLSLSVKPRAAANTSGWWLPVTSLEVKYEWSGDIADAKVGEPLTLTLETVATGSTATQLPEIPVPDVPGIKIYVDNPEFGSRPDTSGLLSIRRDKWSVIPNQAGLLTLPEVVIKWWDTTADVERQAGIPPQQLEVAGQVASNESSAAATNVPEAQQGTTSGGLASEVTGGMGDDSDSQSDSLSAATRRESDSTAADRLIAGNINDGEFVPRHWLWLAVTALTVWFATLSAWWWSARIRRQVDSSKDTKTDNGSERKAFRQMKLLAAAKDADPSAYSNAVLAWAQHRWPHSAVRNLPQVGLCLGDPTLTEKMQRLDQQRFSSTVRADSAVDRASTQHCAITEIQQSLETALQNKPSKTPAHESHALPQL